MNLAQLHPDLRIQAEETEPKLHIQHPDLKMVPAGLHELVFSSDASAREEESEGEPAEQDEHTHVVTVEDLLEQFEEMKTEDGL